MMTNQENEIDEIGPWLLLILTLVGGWIRVLMIDFKGLWLDETFSIWLANHSVGDMLHWIVAVDQHPPLYYLLLHYWVGFTGDSAYYVRLLSALFGAATIPLIFLIGKRLSGTVAGLVAALLLTISPFNVRFAQETRMYTLLTFNASVAIYALARLLTDPCAAKPIGSQFREYLRAWRSPAPVEPDTQADLRYQLAPSQQNGWQRWVSRHRWLPIQAVQTDLAWVALIVFSAATLLTHNTAVLFALATNLFVLGLMLLQRGKKPEAQMAFQAPPLGNWVKAQLGVFILWSPWLLPFIQQSRRVDQEFWIPAPTWNSISGVLKSFLNEPTLPQTSTVWVMWALYGLMAVLGLVYFRKQLSRFFFLAALFAVPFLGELLISLRRPIFYDRTLIWITIPLFLLLAAGVAQLRFRFLIILMVGILTTNNVFGTADYFRFSRKEAWGNAAGYVANFAKQGDLVLFNATWVQIPFDYYFRSFEETYSLQVEKRGVPADMFEGGILEPKMTENDVPRLLSLVEGHPRVFLVYSHDSYTDPKGIIPKTLTSKMKLVENRQYWGVQVQRYEAP